MIAEYFFGMGYPLNDKTKRMQIKRTKHSKQKQNSHTCRNFLLCVLIFAFVFNIGYFLFVPIIKSLFSEADDLEVCSDDLKDVKAGLNSVDAKLSQSIAAVNQLKREIAQAKVQSLNTVEDIVAVDGTKPQLFKFELKLLTFDRLSAVRRCLQSLEDAEYEGDTVDLTIFVDHFTPRPNITAQEHNSLLKLNRDVLKFVEGFKWSHGLKQIHYRQFNAHLQFQWIESFYPLDDHTYAFIVEDDIAVSPYYYKYLKHLITKYRYSRPVDKHIYGISLQKQRFVPGLNSKVKVAHVSNGNQPFLYRLVGTWGQILFPEHWREFRQYFDDRRFKESQKPYLDGLKTDQWYRSRGERLWTPWIIRWSNSRDYYNLYANLGDKALSISHRDGGVNFNKTQGPDAELFTRENEPQFKEKYMSQELVSSEQLLRYDYCFSQIPRGRVLTIEKGSSMAITGIILVPSDNTVLYNQLCALENNATLKVEAKLRQEAYFYTTDEDLANNIAYRGFNVILNKKGSVGDLIKNHVKKGSTLIIHLNKSVLMVDPTYMLLTGEPETIVDKNWIMLHDAEQLVSKLSSNGGDGDNFANVVSELEGYVTSSRNSVKLNLTPITAETSCIRDHDMGCVAVVCKQR